MRQEWHEFQVRKEILKQKEGADVELVFYENDNGVIERKSYTGPLPDGLHLARCLRKLFVGPVLSYLSLTTGVLCRKWAWREFEASDTSVLYPPPSDVKTVAEFHNTARNVPLSANWLNADRQGTMRQDAFRELSSSLIIFPCVATGNIGYQQSGRLPARDPSVNSALPLLGWKASHRCATQSHRVGTCSERLVLTWPTTLPPINSDGTAQLTPISCSRSSILQRYASGCPAT